MRYLAKGLLMAKRYTDAIHVCETSIVHSPFEEEVHRLLMLAYAKDGRSRKAVDHYQQISRQFYDEFGVTMNPETVKLYRKIAQSMHNVEMDLGVIKEDLMEVSRLPGATATTRYSRISTGSMPAAWSAPAPPSISG